MGLDTTHNAFHGAYSAFNRFRQFVCDAMGDGCSFPPHYRRDEEGRFMEDFRGRLLRKEEFDENFFYVGKGFSRSTHPGLFALLEHSDCDGEISPEMCRKIADELEALIPSAKRLKHAMAGHIVREGGYIGVMEQSIAGCRLAAKNNEPLEFL